MSESKISPLISSVESIRDRPLVAVSGGIGVDLLPVLYDRLQEIGRSERLDLMLLTSGGDILAARRIALLMRDFSSHVSVLVPYRCWSSGTIVCLGADEIVMGALGELGPIDPQLGSNGSGGPGPDSMSSESIRLFGEMATKWFGVKPDQDGAELLAVVARNVFPSTLTNFYRSDQLVRTIGKELISFQKPNASEVEKEEIIRKLIEGFFSHDYQIIHRDAIRIGLNAKRMSEQEESACWALSQEIRSQVDADIGSRKIGVASIMASKNAIAKNLYEWKPIIGSPDEERGIPSFEWVVEKEVTQ